MAEIYLAKAFGLEGTDKILAVKVILSNVSADPTFVDLFVDEAKLVVLLNHANIAQVYELGKTEDNYFIAMEYVPGRDLRAVLDRATHSGITLPEHIVLHIVAQVLEGLDFAHRKTDHGGQPLGIVHRDVSPQNVLLGYSGEVKLCDFGIAKREGGTSDRHRLLQGKYGYMSPEQVRGERVDARTDVFATGIILWELLTQQRLFTGSTDLSVLEKVKFAEVYPPSTISPRVPPPLEAVVMKALAQNPAERYATASDMHDAVVRVMLEHYTQATAREVSNLMHNLFVSEYQADLQRLEDARLLRAPEPEPNTGDSTEPSPSALPAARTPTPQPAARTPTPQPALRAPTPEPMSVPGEVYADTDPNWTPPTDSELARQNQDTDPELRVRPAPGPKTQQFHEHELARAMAAQGHMLGEADKLGDLFALPEAGRGDTKVRRAYRRGLSPVNLVVVAAFALGLGLVLLSWTVWQPGRSSNRGKINVISAPSEAVVIIDGNTIGKTPYASSELVVGDHTLTVEKPGYQSETRTITIAPNVLLPLHLTLRKLGSDPRRPPPR
jgi:serine/threonine protein kinase